MTRRERSWDPPPSPKTPETALQRQERLKAELTWTENKSARVKRWGRFLVAGLILAFLGVLCQIPLLFVGTSLLKEGILLAVDASSFAYLWWAHGRSLKIYNLLQTSRVELDRQLADVTIEVEDPAFARTLPSLMEST